MKETPDKGIENYDSLLIIIGLLWMQKCNNEEEEVMKRRDKTQEKREKMLSFYCC